MDDPKAVLRPRLLLLIAVCLVAANMRPTVTAIGPLLTQIGSDTGMSAGTLGLIASVPLLAWGLFSALDHKERIPAGFNISWSWLFSELRATKDSSARYTTYQNFYFRGRRPL